MRNALLFVLTFAACSDDAQTTVDSPPATTCTGLIYDRCSADTQCMSGMCRMFNNLGVMLCTQACTPTGTACPMQGAAAVQCPSNSMICRPDVANTCTPP